MQKEECQADTIIKNLELQKHEEGGYFRQTYKGPMSANNRTTMTMIYFVITKASPLTHWVMNKSDLITTHIKGGKLRYFFIRPQTGKMQEHLLSHDICKGQSPQLLVPHNIWSVFLLEEGQYALTTEAVSPGFEYEDMTLTNAKELIEKFPHLKQQIDNIEKNRINWTM